MNLRCHLGLKSSVTDYASASVETSHGRMAAAITAVVPGAVCAIAPGRTCRGRPSVWVLFRLQLQRTKWCLAHLHAKLNSASGTRGDGGGVVLEG